jgi:DNA-binding IclR family transcriptional regulator
MELTKDRAMAERKPRGTAHRRVPAVTRAVEILRRLGASDEPMGVNPLARSLDLVPSTCLHILRVLTAEGLVDFDPASKRYSIGVGILPIARSAIQRNGFASLAQPLLAELSERFGVTAVATQIVDTQMVVVALSHAQMPFRPSTELGSRFPAFISATGRCVAAFGGFDRATLRSRFTPLKWDNPPSFDDWTGQVDRTRRDGYGIDKGEYIRGMTIVAVPLLDAEGAVARSLVAIGMAENVESAGIENIARDMLRMRDKVAGLLIGD